jgi:hypothetical protein
MHPDATELEEMIRYCRLKAAADRARQAGSQVEDTCQPAFRAARFLPDSLQPAERMRHRHFQTKDGTSNLPFFREKAQTDWGPLLELPSSTTK